MSVVGAIQWYSQFSRVARRGQHPDILSRAALEGDLTEWTRELTSVATETCHDLGWEATARGHTGNILPIVREEYLGIDVIAFQQEKGSRWRSPVLALELENLLPVTNIEYSVWKVATVRASLRGVYCYRRNADEIGGLLSELTDGVMKDVSRSIGRDESLFVVVGTRAEAASFPDGFFRPYSWSSAQGAFRRLGG